MRVAVVDGATTSDLRRRVLRSGLPFEPSTPMPGDGVDSIHLAALEGVKVVGCVAVLPAPCPSRPGAEHPFQLRGMAVEPGAQGRGIGSQLLAAAVEQVRAQGGRQLWCNARTTAVTFYRRHGMQTSGPEFVSAETGIAHFLMCLELPADPTPSMR